MLGVLWFAVWVIVVRAYYDEYSWYTSDYGAEEIPFVLDKFYTQKNFSDSLRSFADMYGIPDNEEEVTLAKAKIKLRQLRIYKLSKDSSEIDKESDQALPLPEGANSCEMGWYTKVECNYCTCVGGQLYMCTGAICVDYERWPPFKDLSVVSNCEEGVKRRLDSCNYCLCHNGKEICSTKDCRLRQDRKLLRSVREDCAATTARIKDFCGNKCICHDNELYCTRYECTYQSDYNLPKVYITKPLCEGNGHWKELCNNRCFCHNGESYCTQYPCEPGKRGRKRKLYLSSCEEGTQQKMDSCNDCICINGEYICTTKSCENSEVDTLRQLPKQCDVYDIKVVDCNRCMCQGHRWLCTLRVCSVLKDKPRRPQKNIGDLFGTCKQGSVTIIDGCECTCSEAGDLICPELKCSNSTLTLENEDESIEKMKTNAYPCMEDEVTYEDGNTCICVDGEFLCEEPLSAPDQTWVSSAPTVTKKKRIKTKKRPRRPVHSAPTAHLQFEGCARGMKRREDSCNYCLCRHSMWYCERKKCVTPTPSDYLRTDEAPKPKCSAGTRYRLGACNYCYCNHDRELICSRHECAQYTPNIPLRSHYSEEECDEIGQFRRGEDCNYCWCSHLYKWRCSQYKCSGPGEAVLLRATDYCKEQGRFQQINDCNYCWCNHQNRWRCTEHATCDENPDFFEPLGTLLRTGEELADANVCVEGRRREVDPCNYCVCQNGVELCTNHRCPKSMFPEPKCTPGEKVHAPDPCNRCICLNSDILCTNLPCLLRQGSDTENSDKCVEGEKYNLDDGCNYCLCQNGHEFCTSRACLVKSKPTLIGQSDCKEGEITAAEDGCNMCVCLRGKMTCTDRQCRHSDEIKGGSSRETYNNRRHGTESRKLNMRRSIKEKCLEGQSYTAEGDEPGCFSQCFCYNSQLLCTLNTCHKKEVNLLYKLEDCVENQPLPSDNPCYSCVCSNGRRDCVNICSGEPSVMNAKSLKASGRKPKTNKGPFCKPFTFFSADENRFCRNCLCLHDGLAFCLLNLCKYAKDIPHHTPEKLYKECEPGDFGYPTKCVTCTCSTRGQWMCTREQVQVCQERNCDENEEFQLGFTPYCAGCKCTVKEWFCSLKPDSCYNYSDVKCPAGQFVYNPREPCSICMCGKQGSKNLCITDVKCNRKVKSQNLRNRRIRH